MSATRIPLNFDSFPKPTYGKRITLHTRIFGMVCGFGVVGLFVLLTWIIAYKIDPEYFSSPIGNLFLSSIVGALFGAAIPALWFLISVASEMGHRGIIYSVPLQIRINKAQDEYVFSQQDASELLRWHHSLGTTLDSTLTWIRKEDYSGLPDTIAFGTTYKEADNHTTKFDLFWSQKSGFYLLAEDLEAKPKSFFRRKDK